MVATATETGPSALTPAKLGTVVLPNRLGLGPINSALFEPDGSISDLHFGFYERFVEEGLGLVYVGAVAVTQAGRSNSRSLVLDRPERSLGIRRIAEACRQSGTVLAVQLMHVGRQARSSEIGHETVAPSPLPCPVMDERPRELTPAEISRICRQFGEAAAIAEDAGAHLIEIHAAHGYLVGAFLSPYSNVRSDHYAATPGGRSRFLSELLDEVGRRTSLPIGLRVSVVENVDGGLRVEDLAGTLGHAREALAFLSVSGGVYVRERDVIIPSRDLGRMLWEAQAASLRQWLGVPVAISGNFHDLDEVDDVVRRRSADVVLMVRALLADPMLLRKWTAGRRSEVQPCIDCRLCKYHTRREPHVYCPFNTELVAIRRNWLRTRNPGGQA